VPPRRCFARDWPALARTNQDNEVLARIIEFIDRNDHFFLNYPCRRKAMLEPAEGVEGSTIVTVMARNGTDFGMRLSSMPERWFTAPAGKVRACIFHSIRKRCQPGYWRQHHHETAGYGGMAMAAAPAITQFVEAPTIGIEGHPRNV